MHAKDVLMYGHRWVHLHVDDLAEEEWERPYVCGIWSTKEIIAHLASFELMLAELLQDCAGGEGPFHTLDAFRSMDGDEFNAREVAKRRAGTPQAVLAEYDRHHAQVRVDMAGLSPETLRQVGVLPWYGAEYDLEDFLVYSFYGHKREHCAQIAVFRDKLKPRA